MNDNKPRRPLSEFAPDWFAASPRGKGNPKVERHEDIRDFADADGSQDFGDGCEQIEDVATTAGRNPYYSN